MEAYCYNFLLHSLINFSLIQVLDVSQFSYVERVCAATQQGLVNRNGPMLYLDYGIYDDPAARRTNEVFLDDGCGIQNTVLYLVIRIVITWFFTKKSSIFVFLMKVIWLT